MTASVNPIRGSGEDAARRAGITYRKLNWYVIQGLLSIDNPHPGPGIRRHFSDSDVDALRVLERLMSLGDTRAEVRSALHERFREIAVHVQRHGVRGKFELMPGITVDLRRLVTDIEAVA